MKSKLPQNIIRLLEREPLAYASYIRLTKLNRGSEVSDHSYVPYITKKYFIIAILAYISLNNIKFLLQNIVPSYSTDDIFLRNKHVFALGTKRESKYKLLLPVATSLDKRGAQSAILCTTEVAEHIKQNTDFDGTILTFRDQLGNVSLLRICFFIPHVLKVVYETFQECDCSVLSAGFIQVLNHTFLEMTKSEIIKAISQENPCVHTLSPNPYSIMVTEPEKVFYYQFATKINLLEGDVGRNKDLPSYAPVNYIVWSDKWATYYRKQAHPESEVFSLGSPWFEKIESEDVHKDTEYEILFIGQYAGESEELLREVVDFVEAENISMAIRLHPADPNGDWYHQKGWGKYIVSFSSLTEAISKSKVVITDFSTCFVESSVLKKPVIVLDSRERGFKELDPKEFVVFSSSIENVLSDLDDILDNPEKLPIEKGGKLVKYDNSTEAIVSLIDQKC